MKSDHRPRAAEVFQGLEDEQLTRLEEIARVRSLREGEYLFVLGDTADRLFVVLSGKVELCFPVSLKGVMKDVRVESKAAGEALGWSAFVKPFRFTLSARASETAEVAAYPCKDLEKLFDEDPKVGCVLMSRISELIGRRLLHMQALWARELQRTVMNGFPKLAVPTKGDAGSLQAQPSGPGV